MTLAAIVLMLVPVLSAAIAELFWLNAQNKAARMLLRILDRTGSAAETEQLMGLLISAQREVLTARVSISHGRRVRRRRYRSTPGTNS
jgi:hypothetical protein